MTASVDIKTETRANVLSVPLASVTTRSPKDEKEESDEESGGESTSSGQLATQVEDDVEVVFVNDNGLAKKVLVKTGISDYDNIEILEGLEVGQEVVTGPFVVVSKRLKGGERIKQIGDKDKEKEVETASAE